MHTMYTGSEEMLVQLVLALGIKGKQNAKGAMHNVHKRLDNSAKNTAIRLLHLIPIVLYVLKRLRHRYNNNTNDTHGHNITTGLLEQQKQIVMPVVPTSHPY